MKRTINKIVTEEIDIDLSYPKCVSYHNGIFYKFTEIDGELQIIRVSNHSGLDIQVRSELFESDKAALVEDREGFKVITSVEFDQMLMNTLQKFGLLVKELIYRV